MKQTLTFTSLSIPVLHYVPVSIVAVVPAVNTQVQDKSHGRLFAVVHINGHQFKITSEDLILLSTNATFPDVGQKIFLDKVGSMLCVYTSFIRHRSSISAAFRPLCVVFHIRDD